MYVMVIADKCGVVRGGFEDKIFEGFKPTGEVKVFSQKHMGRLNLYNATLEVDGQKCDVTVIRQDLVAVFASTKDPLRKIAKRIKDVYPEYYLSHARDIGKSDAKKLPVQIFEVDGDLNGFERE